MAKLAGDSADGAAGVASAPGVAGAPANCPEQPAGGAPEEKILELPPCPANFAGDSSAKGKYYTCTVSNKAGKCVPTSWLPSWGIQGRSESCGTCWRLPGDRVAVWRPHISSCPLNYVHARAHVANGHVVVVPPQGTCAASMRWLSGQSRPWCPSSSSRTPTTAACSATSSVWGAATWSRRSPSTRRSRWVGAGVVSRTINVVTAVQLMYAERQTAKAPLHLHATMPIWVGKIPRYNSALDAIRESGCSLPALV